MHTKITNKKSILKTKQVGENTGLDLKKTCCDG